MKITKPVLVFAGFALSLVAADPFAGTWKMDSAKTKYKAGTAPKEQTITITEAGSDLSVKATGVASDGSKISMAYTVPAAGGAGKIVESAAYDGISNKRLAATEREITYMKGGKGVYTAHSKVAADGNSMTVDVKGVNAVGQTVDGSVHYTKQK